MNDRTRNAPGTQGRDGDVAATGGPAPAARSVVAAAARRPSAGRVRRAAVALALLAAAASTAGAMPDFDARVVADGHLAPRDGDARGPDAAGVEPDRVRLTPLGSRLSDEAIARDQRLFERTEARLRALNDAGRRIEAYPMAAARCWLAAGLHEYRRNDAGPFPQRALDEALRLIGAMERGDADEPPAVSGSPLRPDGGAGAPRSAAAVPAGPRPATARPLRADLRARADALLASGARACRAAAAPLACGEVALEHAANEHAQLGWTHAASYVAIAEERFDDAAAALRACSGAAR